MRMSPISMIRIFCLASLCWIVSPALAREAKQDARIAALISAVENMQGGQFIRDGQAHDAKAAADHLRLKLKNAGNRVQTAEQFIEYCASKSSTTGQKYRIRTTKGAEMDAAEFFKQKLKEFDEKEKS